MKKALIAALFLSGMTGLHSQNAQDKLKIDAFGKHMFTLIRSLDTTAMEKSLPVKQDLVDYVQTTAMVEEAKKDFLSHADGALATMRREINGNVRKTHTEAADSGMVWKNARYTSTEIKYWPKPDAKSFSPVAVMIFFAYNGKTLGIGTSCIVSKKGVLLVDRLKLYTR